MIFSCLIFTMWLTFAILETFENEPHITSSCQISYLIPETWYYASSCGFFVSDTPSYTNTRRLAPISLSIMAIYDNI